MGLSASQARLLTLTTRLSDLELQAEQISNAKIRLSSDSESVSNKYSDALNTGKYTILSGVNNSGIYTYSDLTYNSLTGPDSPLVSQYCVTDVNNNVVVPKNVALYFEASSSLDNFLSYLQNDDSTSSSYNETYYINLFNKMSSGFVTITSDNASDKDWMQSQIKSGNLLLQKYNNGDWENSSWFTNTDIVEQEASTSETSQAEAEYEASMAKIKTKDSKYDLELKKIDTEHSAIQTEIDSVKKVIDKNIERTFKTFDG